MSVLERVGVFLEVFSDNVINVYQKRVMLFQIIFHINKHTACANLELKVLLYIIESYIIIYIKFHIMNNNSNSEKNFLIFISIVADFIILNKL